MWCALKQFHTGQVLCSKSTQVGPGIMASSEKRGCGMVQTMSDIVNECPVSKLTMVACKDGTPLMILQLTGWKKRRQEKDTHARTHARAHARTHAHTHTHTHNRLTAFCPGLPGHQPPLGWGWWRSTVVERRSLTGELSLSCARLAADG